MAGKLLIVHGGGPTAVMNCSLYGAVDEAPATSTGVPAALQAWYILPQVSMVPLPPLQRRKSKPFLPMTSRDRPRPHLPAGAGL